MAKPIRKVRLTPKEKKGFGPEKMGERKRFTPEKKIGEKPLGLEGKINPNTGFFEATKDTNGIMSRLGLAPKGPTAGGEAAPAARAVEGKNPFTQPLNKFSRRASSEEKSASSVVDKFFSKLNKGPENLSLNKPLSIERNTPIENKTATESVNKFFDLLNKRKKK